MLHELIVPQISKMLHNLSHWLDKAQAHADAKKFDSAVLVKSRLAPDQFDLSRQVYEDSETTLPELKERIAKVLSFLAGVKAKDFEGAEARQVSLPRWGGKYLSGSEYVHQYWLPNFYFHTTTAYAILRHNGVDLGKTDYIGELPFKN